MLRQPVTRACDICGGAFDTRHARKLRCSEVCTKERNRRAASRSYWARPENLGRAPSRVMNPTPDHRRKVRKNQRLKATYGISLETYEVMRSAQNDACAICRQPFSERLRGEGTAHVDHDHKTGIVRGILCHSCNVGLGSFRDNPDLLSEAIGYLERAGQSARLCGWGSNDG